MLDKFNIQEAATIVYPTTPTLIVSPSSVEMDLSSIRTFPGGLPVATATQNFNVVAAGAGYGGGQPPQLVFPGLLWITNGSSMAARNTTAYMYSNYSVCGFMLQGQMDGDFSISVDHSALWFASNYRHAALTLIRASVLQPIVYGARSGMLPASRPVQVDSLRISSSWTDAFRLPIGATADIATAAGAATTAAQEQLPPALRHWVLQRDTDAYGHWKAWADGSKSVARELSCFAQANRMASTSKNETGGAVPWYSLHPDRVDVRIPFAPPRSFTQPTLNDTPTVLSRPCLPFLRLFVLRNSQVNVTAFGKPLPRRTSFPSVLPCSRPQKQWTIPWWHHSAAPCRCNASQTRLAPRPSHKVPALLTFAMAMKWGRAGPAPRRHSALTGPLHTRQWKTSPSSSTIARCG